MLDHYLVCNDKALSMLMSVRWWNLSAYIVCIYHVYVCIKPNAMTIYYRGMCIVTFLSSIINHLPSQSFHCCQRNLSPLCAIWLRLQVILLVYFLKCPLYVGCKQIIAAVTNITLCEPSQNCSSRARLTLLTVQSGAILSDPSVNRTMSTKPTTVNKVV